MGWPGPMTHRQFLAWQQWLDDQWNQPNRTDQYLQAIACHVRKSQSVEPEKILFETFRLKFETKKTPSHGKPLDPKTGLPMTDQQIARFNKARAMAAVGMFSIETD